VSKWRVGEIAENQKDGPDMYALIKAIRISIFGLALISIVLCCGASAYFCSNRPLTPCPEQYRTYALDNHGVIVYLTRVEHRLIDWSFDASFCFFLIAFILFAIEKKNSGNRAQ
jgi:hypothetical protein